VSPFRRIDPWPFVVLAIVVATCLAIYFRTLDYPFVNWDDYSLISGKEYIQSLTRDNIETMFSLEKDTAFQPIRDLSYAIDYHFWELDPTGYHITNLLFYVLNSLLAYLFIRLFLDRKWLAVFGAAFFAAHPLHVEAVAWLSARKEVLSGFFFMASFLLYAPLLKRGSASASRLALSLLSFAVACLAKPTAVSLPALIILYDYSFGERPRLRSTLGRWRYYVPYLAISLATTALTIYVGTKKMSVLKTFHGGSFQAQLLTSLTALVKSLGLLVVPFNLSARYVDYAYQSMTEPAVIVSLVIAVLLVLLARDMWSRSRRSFFALIWIFITFAPVSNLIPISTLVADRYLYLPSYGYVLLVAIGAGFLLDRARAFDPRLMKKLRGAIVTALIVLVAVFSLSSYRRSGVWEDSVSLWRSVVEQDAMNALGYYALGNVYVEKGMLDEAIKVYRKSLSVYPHFVLSRVALGHVCVMKHDYDRAIFHFRTALRYTYDDLGARINYGLALRYKGFYEDAVKQYQEALQMDSTAVAARYGLAEAYRAMKQFESAAEEYKRLLDTTPKELSAAIHFNLGLAYHGKGAYAEAESSYFNSIAVDSNYVDPYFALGNLYRDQGKREKAVTYFKKALSTVPTHLGAINNLANIYQQNLSFGAAIEMYDLALGMSPGDSIVLNNLGLAYLAQGDFAGAESTFSNLVELYPKSVEAHLNLGALYSERGYLEKAASELQHALEIDSLSADVYYNLACVKARQGRPSEALESLERAFEYGFRELDYARSDPDLKSIRKTVRFRELIEEYAGTARRERR